MKNSDAIFCYAGNILWVNLTNGEIKTEPTLKYSRDWLGSGGIAVKILFDELTQNVQPYDPENILIFGTGVLQGTTAPGSCKMTVSSLGPMTGGWATGASDSRMGGNLKRAGYDLLIITGKAEKPVYLYIEDDRIEIMNAAFLWGKDTWQTTDMLRAEFGDQNLSVVCIGPAGENLVRGACIVQDKVRAFGRCGTGSVMGSKNLKAVIAKGSGSIRVAQPDRFMQSVRKIRARIVDSTTAENYRKFGTYSAFEAKQKASSMNFKNFREAILPDDFYNSIDPRKLIEKYKVRRSSFPGCPIGCGHVLEFNEGKFKGLMAEKNQWEVFTSLQTRLAVKDPQFMVKANAYANQMGMDVDMLGGSIGWAIECFEKGIINENDTGGLVLHWGDVDQILHLIDLICHRQGFGNLLAEGCARAAEAIGRGSDYYCLHLKKQDLYEPLRGAMAWALGTVVSTRGGGHTTGTPQMETIGKINPEKMSVLYSIDPNDVDPLSYEGKPEIVIFTEALHRIANCLGICQFNTVWVDFDFVGLPDMAELFSAATGIEINVDDLKIIAMRQLNLEKVFNIRHAGFSREDDFPTARDLNEPIPSGDLAGWRIDKTKWGEMLDRYYILHGWDPITSFPTQKTLEKLGIGYAYQAILERGRQVAKE